MAVLRDGPQLRRDRRNFASRFRLGFVRPSMNGAAAVISAAFAFAAYCAINGSSRAGPPTVRARTTFAAPLRPTPHRRKTIQHRFDGFDEFPEHLGRRAGRDRGQRVRHDLVSKAPEGITPRGPDAPPRTSPGRNPRRRPWPSRYRTPPRPGPRTSTYPEGGSQRVIQATDHVLSPSSPRIL